MLTGRSGHPNPAPLLDSISRGEGWNLSRVTNPLERSRILAANHAIEEQGEIGGLSRRDASTSVFEILCRVSWRRVGDACSSEVNMVREVVITYPRKQ